MFLPPSLPWVYSSTGKSAGLRNRRLGVQIPLSPRNIHPTRKENSMLYLAVQLIRGAHIGYKTFLVGAILYARSLGRD